MPHQPRASQLSQSIIEIILVCCESLNCAGGGLQAALILYFFFCLQLFPPSVMKFFSHTRVFHRMFGLSATNSLGIVYREYVVVVVVAVS